MLTGIFKDLPHTLNLLNKWSPWIDWLSLIEYTWRCSFNQTHEYFAQYTEIVNGLDLGEQDRLLLKHQLTPTSTLWKCIFTTFMRGRYKRFIIHDGWEIVLRLLCGIWILNQTWLWEDQNMSGRGKLGNLNIYSQDLTWISLMYRQEISMPVNCAKHIFKGFTYFFIAQKIRLHTFGKSKFKKWLWMPI